MTLAYYNIQQFVQLNINDTWKCGTYELVDLAWINIYKPFVNPLQQPRLLKHFLQIRYSSNTKIKQSSTKVKVF